MLSSQFGLYDESRGRIPQFLNEQPEIRFVSLEFHPSG